ncbi:MAG: DUF1572 family protein, partial [Calditrichaceae bacterium]
KNLLEKTIDQMSDEDIFRSPDNHDNSIAVIFKHLSGNLKSRFTDFLTTDGEKEWRNRESEFDIENATRIQLMEMWQRSWAILKEAVFNLSEQDMHKKVTIRGVEFTVEQALARSLAHFSYHVGQIVYLGKHFAGRSWQYLSIPPGGSNAYNQNPTKEKGV